MAPEQIQSCIDACNLCAEACEQQLHAARAATGSTERDAEHLLIRDCAALCRLAAGSLAEVSAAAGVLCLACAQVCRMCAEERNAADQLARACRHCASECERLAGSLPSATALA